MVSNAATVTISVTAVNDTPINTVPGAQSVDEDISLFFSAAGGNEISISDVDAGANEIQVGLTVNEGTLTLSGATGLTFTTGDGTADPAMVFTGTLADVHAALDGVSYLRPPNDNGTDTLTITTSDQGYTGDGGALSVTDTVEITVEPVNDPPVAGVPAAQATTEGTILVFSTANGNAISTSDIDAGTDPLAVTLSVLQGRLTLAQTGAVTFTAGDGVEDATMTFTGAVSDVNAALDGLTYQSDDDGKDTLEFTVDDQGATGAWGPLSDVVAGSIKVANLPPVVTSGAAQTVQEGQPVTFMAGFTDPGIADTHACTWELGDGETAGPLACTSGLTTADHTYMASGTYTVTLTVEDDDGGLGSGTAQVTVTAEEIVSGGSSNSGCGCNLTATAAGTRPTGALGRLLAALLLGAGVMFRRHRNAGSAVCED